jgi:hypothetical protein
VFALTKLLGALNGLAENVQALAGTVAEANAGLRRRLALDAPEEGPALDLGPAADALPAPRRHGRRAAAES